MSDRMLVGDTNGALLRNGVEKQNYATHYGYTNIIRYSKCCEVINAAQKDKNTRVLDVGSGFSILYSFFNTNFAAYGRARIHYRGLEYVQSQVDWVNERYARDDEKKSFKSQQHDLIKDSILDKFQPNSFDVVVAQEIIEHINEERARFMLQEIHQVLADDGKLILSSPNPRKHMGEMLRYPKDHEIEYSFDEMKEMLDDAGFVIKEHYGIGMHLREAKAAGLTDIEKLMLDQQKKMSYALACSVLPLHRPELGLCYFLVCEKK